jgi:putative DNA primase/helicase
MPEGPMLLPHHWQQLMDGSGIAPGIITTRGYRSVVPPEGYTELKRLGFARQQAKLTPGLLIPVLGLDGQPVLYQHRPDTPRINAKGREIKYETPKNTTMHLDFATGQRDFIGNPAIPLWIGEGIKKVDAVRSRGLCAIGLLGVWNWRGTNLDGGKVALADWESVCTQRPRGIHRL